jgi:hypothetical protein
VVGFEDKGQSEGSGEIKAGEKGQVCVFSFVSIIAIHPILRQGAKEN